jgi:hypothetical protein
MVSILGANYVGRDSNPTTAVWGGDLMVGNPRDPSHLRVRELWFRVVVTGKSYYCLDVPHAMLNSGSSGPGQ